MKHTNWIKIISATVLVAVEPLAELVDTILLGFSTPIWVASLAATNVFFSSFCWIFNFLSFGLSARLAHARDGNRLGAQIVAGLLLATILGLTFTPILLLGKNYFLQEVLAIPESIGSSTEIYWSIRVIGFPLTILALAVNGILRGLGRFDLALMMVLTITLVNSLVTSIGLFIFDYGIGAAAFGTVLGYALGVIPALIWIVACYARQNFAWPTKDELFSIGSEGLQVFGRSGALTLCFFIMTALISRLGAVPLAAHQVSMQIWIFSAYVIDGLALIAITDGGYALGRKQYAEFSLLAKQLLKQGNVLGVLFSLGLLILTIPIMNHFTITPEIENALMSLWWIVVLTQPLNAYVYVTDGLLFATRDFSGMRQVMWLALIAFLPFAWVNYSLNSLVGIWLALVFVNIVRSFGNYLLLKRFTNNQSSNASRRNI